MVYYLIIVICNRTIMGVSNANTTAKLTFTMQVADNAKVKGVMSGVEAMKKSGAQNEFIVANMLQAAAMKCPVILRAGGLAQYDKHRSPKSGINLTKTSTQGFFKGALAQEQRFARLDANRNPYPHYIDDVTHLGLKISDADYQHVMPLDINMRDILREISADGDLKISGFDEQSGLLRLEYREGHGPVAAQFNGQFVVNLYAGKDEPQFFSRDWNRPENDPKWNPDKRVITKPEALALLPDSIYEAQFNKTFLVEYTETKTESPALTDIKKAMVFANRPRSVEEFKEAMGANHPHYSLIQNIDDFQELLSTLNDRLGEEEAQKIILDIYENSGTIVAGDWDGMALGHPVGLDPKFKEVINIFAPGAQGVENKNKLRQLTNEYIKQWQHDIQEKNEPLSSVDKKIASIDDISQIVSLFTVSRAGTITPHEFLFQQVLNDAYRDKNNTHYGEKYNTKALQRAMDILVSATRDVDFSLIPSEKLTAIAKNIIMAEFSASDSKVKETMLDKFSGHLINNLPLARRQPSEYYKLPHLQYDMNVHDLYQHGFDMRNPYGSNLDGAWLLITDDGGVFYGQTQGQLIEVLLTGDLLEKNIIDVNHSADLAAGWSRVIERQLQLGQAIPQKTLEKYENFMSNALLSKSNKRIDVSFAELTVPMNSPNIQKQLDAKAELAKCRGEVADKTKDDDMSCSIPTKTV